MQKEQHETTFNPINERDLVDKRNEIAENCFIELEIALKSYQICFGDDLGNDELSLLHSNFAYLISNHSTEHKLAKIDITKFSIPNSPFKTKEGIPTDKLYQLETIDKIHYITNMVNNSKSGFTELAKSGYFEEIKDELMISKSSLLYLLGSGYDKVIMLMNNQYNKQFMLNEN